jgi:hypothetical protein
LDRTKAGTLFPFHRPLLPREENEPSCATVILDLLRILFLRERSLSMTSENHDGDGKEEKDSSCSENLLE